MKNCDRAKPQTQPFQWFLSFPAYRIFRRQNRGKIRYYEEAGNALFFAKTTTKSCFEAGTEIGSGFGPFDCPHPGAAETGSGLRGFHRLSVWCQDSFRLCGSLRQPIHMQIFDLFLERRDVSTLVVQPVGSGLHNCTTMYTAVMLMSASRAGQAPGFDL